MGNCIGEKVCKTVLDSNTGETICKVCGRVIAVDNIISDEAFDVDYIWKSSTHYPVNPELGEKALGSLISNTGKDAGKLKKISSRLRSDRGQLKGLIEFSKIGDKLGLTDFVIQEAIGIFNKVRKDGFTKGRAMPVVVASCCYLVARKNGLNMTSQDVYTKLGVNSKLFYKAYFILCKKLNIDTTKLAIQQPEMHMEKIISKLNIPIRCRNTCFAVLKKMKENELTVGKSPIATAAAACYLGCLYCKFSLTQAQVAYNSGVTEVTIRNRVKDYKQVVDNDVL